MTEVLAGNKRPFEELSERRAKVAKLTADPEWVKEESEEYEKDKEEFTPNEEENQEDDYYEDDIKDEDTTEDKILEDLICIKEIMPEGYDFDDDSLKAIKLLAKDYIVDVFENAKLIAKKIGKRDVVTEEDMQVAVEIMQRSAAKASKPEPETEK